MVQNIFGLFPSEEIFEHIRPDEEITLGIGVVFCESAAGEIGIAHAVLRKLKVAHADARLMLKGDAAHLKARLPVRLRTEALVRGKPRGHHDDEIERQLADGGADIVNVFAVYGVERPPKKCDLHKFSCMVGVFSSKTPFVLFIIFPMCQH